MLRGFAFTFTSEYLVKNKSDMETKTFLLFAGVLLALFVVAQVIISVIEVIEIPI